MKGSTAAVAAGFGGFALVMAACSASSATGGGADSGAGADVTVHDAGPDDASLDQGAEAHSGEASFETSVGPDAEAGALDAGGPLEGGSDAGGVCVATTPATLMACATAVMAGSTSVIEIQGTLTCTGDHACAVSLTLPPGPVTIRGATGAVLRRIDHYEDPLFTVSTNSAVTFSDLVIDENANAPCAPISETDPPVPNPACQDTILVYSAAAATVERTTILYSKASAIVISATAIDVTGSRFVEPHLFGAQLSSATSFVVESSLFERTSSNGLVISGVSGTAASPAIVRANIFEHNHRDNLFYQCGVDDAGALIPCGGGQILVYSDVASLVISGNAIRDGSSDTHPTAGTAGIEIGETDITNLLITGNEIHDCNGSGVAQDLPKTNVTGVQVVGNEMYNNGADEGFGDPNWLNLDAGAEVGTCTTPGCLTIPLGALWVVPSVGVGWESNDLVSSTVAAAGTPISNQASGTATVGAGTEVTLSDGATQIDQVLAR